MRSLHLERKAPAQRVGLGKFAPWFERLAVFALFLSAWSPASGESEPTPPAAVQPANPPAEPAVPENPVPSVVIPPQITAAVADLAAEGFAVRKQAEKRLLAIGPPALAPLLATLKKSSGETGRRVLMVLEQLWLQSPLPEADQLELQLDQYSLSMSPFQAEVDQMLQAHHRLREERAARTLRRLNAIVQLGIDENERELRAKFEQVGGTPPYRISMVIFPRSWKGTNADLWHLRRLSHSEGLQVFVVRNNGITPADMQSMHVGFPGLVVNERAEVFIGVSGGSVAIDDRVGSLVMAVQADSPAQIAGIEIRDLIQEVDGVPVRNFEGLVEELKSKRGYQPIEMTVERFQGEAPMLITVIGLPWESRCFPVPPPPPLAESLLEPPTHRRLRQPIFPN